MTDWRADLCRRSYAAWVVDDPDALVGLFVESCEWNVEAMAATGIGPIYRGHEGLRQFGQVVEFSDRKVLRVTQTDDPPPGWADATPVRQVEGS